MRKHSAAEQHTLEQTIEMLPVTTAWINAIVDRVEPYLNRGQSLTALDIGAAQGRGVVALSQRGFRASGVEPWDEAREIARQLGERLGCDISTRTGRAEEIPFEDETFDLVVATSVMEHVENLERSLAEIFRVLLPGGVFWFNSASSVSPFQNEIALFPAFGWYPDQLKRRIMIWAKNNHPSLVGFTETPALHWWTTKKAYRMLRQAGFGEIWDRWDLRRLEEEKGFRSALLSIIKKHRSARLVANVIVGGCSYAARKPIT